MPEISVIKRDRNAYSRFEFADDRKVFHRWVAAKGPCTKQYWFFDMFDKSLYLEQRKGEICYRYCLRHHDIDREKRGWRFAVARALREIRYMLRQATMNENKQYCPETPGGTICTWLVASTEAKAIENLLKDAAHMPYKTWTNFQKRGYKIVEVDL